MSHFTRRRRPFYCRQWVLGKVQKHLNHASEGLLILGGPGSGKTSVCAEVVHSKSSTLGLGERVIAHYSCQACDSTSLNVSHFVRCIALQLLSDPTIGVEYSRLADSTNLLMLVQSTEDFMNPDSIFHDKVIRLLNSINPSKQLLLVVDGLDESLNVIPPEDVRPEASKSIAELLSGQSTALPDWLTVVFGITRQRKDCVSMFSSYRKLLLDDLRKSHVLADVQDYILSRLDADERLRAQLNQENVQLLHQLHIKSNGCILYLETVLDGIAAGSISLADVAAIPGTLNGLFMSLCQRHFGESSSTQFAEIRPLFEIMLAASSPLTTQQARDALQSQLTVEQFASYLSTLKPFIVEGATAGTWLFFHDSFAEWLADIKHCTAQFKCDSRAGLTRLLQNPEKPGERRETLVPPPPPRRDFSNRYEQLRDGSASPKLQAKRSQQPQSQLSAMEELLANLSVSELETRPLWNAASRGDDDTVREMLSKGVNFQLRTEKGETALSLSVHAGHEHVAELLLRAGASPDVVDGDGWTPLRSAAWSGSERMTQLLLGAGATPDLCGADERTPLRAAAWGGHAPVVRCLLRAGADPNARDSKGRTALMSAAYMGHNAVCKDLLAAGALVDTRDGDTRTALMISTLAAPAACGDCATLHLLLDSGADVNARDTEDTTALILAANAGHYAVCELLLEADADVEAQDAAGRRPVYLAALNGHSLILRLLLFWGANGEFQDAAQRTLLSLAAAAGNADCCDLLLQRGLDESHRDAENVTPLHLAAGDGHVEAAALLVERGALVNAQDNAGRTPLAYAAQGGHVGVTRLLLSAGAEPSLPAADGRSPLRLAAINEHAEVVSELLAAGALLDQVDADGHSTLFLLALGDCVSLAASLLEYGACVDLADTEGRTPLHVAAWQGHSNMVALLLDKGANANAVDKERRSVLHSAAWQGHGDVAKLLLARGARVDHVCCQGATALCVAAQEGHSELVDLLVTSGADPAHTDQFGRTALRMALKNDHADVVALLERVAQRARPAGTSTSQNSTDSGITKGVLTRDTVTPAAMSSPSDSPLSTAERTMDSSGNLSSSSAHSAFSGGVNMIRHEALHSSWRRSCREPRPRQSNTDPIKHARASVRLGRHSSSATRIASPGLQQRQAPPPHSISFHQGPLPKAPPAPPMENYKISNLDEEAERLMYAYRQQSAVIVPPPAENNILQMYQDCIAAGSAREMEGAQLRLYEQSGLASRSSYLLSDRPVVPPPQRTKAGFVNKVLSRVTGRKKS